MLTQTKLVSVNEQTPIYNDKQQSTSSRVINVELGRKPNRNTKSTIPFRNVHPPQIGGATNALESKTKKRF